MDKPTNQHINKTPGSKSDSFDQNPLLKKLRVIIQLEGKRIIDLFIAQKLLPLYIGLKDFDTSTEESINILFEEYSWTERAEYWFRHRLNYILNQHFPQRDISLEPKTVDSHSPQFKIKRRKIKE
ncbi:MAG: hypothetical protein AAFY45_27240 [Bacteroidota bacterium]